MRLEVASYPLFLEVNALTTVYLCQIPTFSSDYKNVAHFTTRLNQISYMNERCILNLTTNAKIDNFTDSITLNYTMDSLIRKCDYLYGRGSDGKYFFYFITNMEQLTTSTVKVYLELDVWQTYHLDLTFYPSYVERMHVKRWDADDYPMKEVVPEPLNVGEMVVTRNTPRVKTNQGNYIYTTSSPIGLVTKDTGTGGGSDEPIPPTPSGDCGNPELGIPTPNGFLFIKGYEGLAQYAHNIGDGVMTIGYGCTDAYDGDNYAMLKANEPVSDDLASSVMAESLVSNYGIPLKNSLASDGIVVNAHEFDAILSFVYNAGLGSWNNSPMRTALINGDKATVYDSWLTTNILPGTQFEAGLRARRQAEANIFKSAEYELRTIVIYGQGGSVVGSLEASESVVPPLISNECQQGQATYDCLDEMGNKWLFPTSGTISSLYPNYPDGTYHGAIDIAGNNGYPIYPPADGCTVYRSGWNTGGYGNLCVLYHEASKTYHYLAHQQELPLVSEGQKVDKNTVIGYVGSTGNSTGPHLHWEIRQEDLSTKINPCATPTLSLGDTIVRGGMTNGGQ